MNAAWGAGLLAATVLLFAWAYGQYRRPQPKAWTESEILTIALTLAMIGCFAFGLAFLGLFAANVQAESRWLESLAVAGAGLALCWVVAPRLMAPARRTPDAPVGLVIPMPASDPNPKAPSGLAGLGGKSGRRRAA